MKVEIYDQTYNVAGDLDPAYVEELAQLRGRATCATSPAPPAWWIP